MKKIIIAMMLVLPMLASAQKFGYINQQEFFAQMPEMAQVKLKMDTINAQYESQLASMNEEIQKKYQDYQAQEPTMADAIKQIRQQELQEMQQRSNSSIRPLSRTSRRNNRTCWLLFTSAWSKRSKQSASVRATPISSTPLPWRSLAPMLSMLRPLSRKNWVLSKIVHRTLTLCTFIYG